MSVTVIFSNPLAVQSISSTGSSCTFSKNIKYHFYGKPSYSVSGTYHYRTNSGNYIELCNDKKKNGEHGELSISNIWIPKSQKKLVVKLDCAFYYESKKNGKAGPNNNGYITISGIYPQHYLIGIEKNKSGSHSHYIVFYTSSSTPNSISNIDHMNITNSKTAFYSINIEITETTCTWKVNNMQYHKYDISNPFSGDGFASFSLDIYSRKTSEGFDKSLSVKNIKIYGNSESNNYSYLYQKEGPYNNTINTITDNTNIFKAFEFN